MLLNSDFTNCPDFAIIFGTINPDPRNFEMKTGLFVASRNAKDQWISNGGWNAIGFPMHIDAHAWCEIGDVNIMGFGKRKSTYKEFLKNTNTEVDSLLFNKEYKSDER